MPHSTIVDTETTARECVNAARRVEQWNASRPKPINTRTHGMLDYTLSPALLLAPKAFGVESGAACLAPRIAGASSLAYSALTRYELGIKPLIPMKTHLILDAVSGAMLALSPWLFGFGKRNRPGTWVPHLAVAALEMTIVALSDDTSTR